MTSPILFHTSIYHSSDELPLYPNSILFHGDSVDDRGQSSVNIESSNISQRVTVNYDYEGMKISVGNKVINADPVSYTHLDVYKRQKFLLWPSKTG